MKIIFFGSDDFAAAHLKALTDSDHEVAGCVTQPDRPKGRGMKVAVSSVKQCAQEHGIPVLQPLTLKDGSFVGQLKALNGDIFVVIAYGRFLPGDVLAVPEHGAVNVHASLLPQYRGAAPINWAVINGETRTGISIIQINEKMDAGDVFAEATCGIDREDTAMTLRAKLAELGPPLLLKVLNDVAAGKAKPKPQDDSRATLAPKMTKELGCIAWTKSAAEIHNLVRGTLPWPGAYTRYKGKSLKILEACIVDNVPSGTSPGTVVDVSKDGITIAAGNGGLLARKVHLQDAKPMDASTFVRGHEVKVGFVFE